MDLPNRVAGQARRVVAEVKLDKLDRYHFQAATSPVPSAARARTMLITIFIRH